MRGKVALSTIICLLIVVLSIAQLFISNKLTTEGLELARLEEETKVLSESNAQLEEEVTKSLALTHIASKAAERGMIKENSVLSISSSTRIALNQ